jgi:hypothetical protein
LLGEIPEVKHELAGLLSIVYEDIAKEELNENRFPRS